MCRRERGGSGEGAGESRVGERDAGKRGGPAVHFYFRCCLKGQGHERPEDPDGQTGKTGFLCFWAPDIACCLEEAFLTV